MNRNLIGSVRAKDVKTISRVGSNQMWARWLFCGSGRVTHDRGSCKVCVDHEEVYVTSSRKPTLITSLHVA